MNATETRIWHEVLHRDKGYCQYCGCDLLSSPTAFFAATVDHVVAVAAGGKFEVDNLVLSCSACNSYLTQSAKLTTFGERRAHVRKTLLTGIPEVPPHSPKMLWYFDELTRALRSRLEGDTVIPTKRKPQQPPVDSEVTNVPAT